MNKLNKQLYFDFMDTNSIELLERIEFQDSSSDNAEEGEEAKNETEKNQLLFDFENVKEN